MDESKNNFNLVLKGLEIAVERHYIGSQTIFRISFPDKRSPLIVTRANRPQTGKFWSSIPEGRQQEAEEVGILISNYFKL